MKTVTTAAGRALLVVVVAAFLAACTEHGSEGLEYRWGSTPTWSDAPPPGASHGDELLVRARVPTNLGPRPALHIYKPPELVAADIDGAPIDVSNHWSVQALPPDSGGKWLTVHYRLRYAVREPVISFGSADTLATEGLTGDLAPFGLGLTFFIVGLAALASFLLRPNRAWSFFGLFAVAMGTMTILEVQDFVALVPAIATARDPVHEVAIWMIACAFAGFVAEVFGGRRVRVLRLVSWATLVGAILALALHFGGVVHLRRLRAIPSLATFATLALAAFIARRRARAGDRKGRVFLVGIVLLLVTAIPDVLTGLGVFEVHLAMFGVTAFVIVMALVLYGQYQDKELALNGRIADLDAKRKEVEALNVELRHQISERSRDLARVTPSLSGSAFPMLGVLVAGRYRVVRALGSGAMGAVFEVERTSDGTRLALKAMTGHRDQDAARFAREVEITAKVSHPNLVSVFDVGIGEWGAPFMVMELVAGGSLADAACTDHTAVLRVLAAAAAGLDALHVAGVVHRDLKPSNVLVSSLDDKAQPANVKLADFGIARLTMASPFDATMPNDSNASLTQTGALLGTPIYMAPEQVRSAATVGPAADVFSFGVMAYELLAGRLPFEMPIVFRALAGAPLPPPPTFRAHVEDTNIAAMLDACLSYEPQRRPTAGVLALVLADALRVPVTSTDVVPAVAL